MLRENQLKQVFERTAHSRGGAGGYARKNKHTHDQENTIRQKVKVAVTATRKKNTITEKRKSLTPKKKAP